MAVMDGATTAIRTLKPVKNRYNGTMRMIRFRRNSVGVLRPSLVVIHMIKPLMTKNISTPPGPNSNNFRSVPSNWFDEYSA